MEFVCFFLFVGAIWWAVASYQSNKEKQRAEQPSMVVTSAPPSSPPWRVSQSLVQTQQCLRDVKEAADAADGAGAAVPLADIHASVNEGWAITSVLANKIDALRRTRGEHWSSLPVESQQILDADAVRLDQLNQSLRSMRDDITNMTAAVGWAEPRIQALDDHLRATRYALQQFPH